MSRSPQIMICDDDQTFHFALKTSLKGKYECRSAYNTEEGLTVARNHQLDLLVLDIQMRTPDEGIKAIPRFKEIDPDLAIIISSGIADFNIVREAMKLGAADYVVKGAEPESILITISQALERRSILQLAARQNFEASSLQKRNILIGESPAIQALRKTIDRMRQSTANVVITGETGTGKEVVARQLRRTFNDGTLAPFVAIDSATIQTSTAESTLFGHEKGAFTGADRASRGLFEQADGGIIYFDEIGNMPLEIQAKLLRAIQEKEVVRLGSSRVIPLNFRVVCATNRDLQQMSESGHFKDDLLQRLSVLPIHLAPLRERREDIPLLIQHFLSTQLHSGGPIEFTDAAVEALQSYSWPGNIRELANVVAYVTTMADGPDVDVADLPPRIRDCDTRCRSASAATISPASELSFYEQVAAFEKEVLRREYEKYEGNISKIALNLRMDRSHLYTKLKEAGLHKGRGAKTTRQP